MGTTELHANSEEKYYLLSFSVLNNPSNAQFKKLVLAAAVRFILAT